MKGRSGSLWMVLVFLLQVSVFGQNRNMMSREEYIETYADLAMREMVRVGIPASITLAQGCLESNNGNSTLARKGNNHFGIKCHDWTGKKMYHDDDERDECFRSYNSAYHSYMDHSDFLTSRPRYAFLFELKPHDYRGWAKGLKKAGYATASNYASLLIQIIEQNELFRYDMLVLEGGLANESDDANNHSPARVNGPNIYTVSALDSNDNWAYFSNYGNPPLDYCEPGVNITSTWKNGGYNTISGTSMATPHMAGLLLLGGVKSDGTVSNDPDKNADPIGVH